MKPLYLVFLLLVQIFTVGCVDRVKPIEESDEGLTVGGYPVVMKTIPPLKFAYHSATIEKRHLESRTREIAKSLFEAIGKQDQVNIIGPLTYVMSDLNASVPDVFIMDVGFPLDGEPGSSGERSENGPVDNSPGQYEFRELNEFRCLTIRVPLEEKYTRSLWVRMHQAAYKKGYKPSGEGRTVITFNDTGSGYVMEMQLGLRS